MIDAEAGGRGRDLELEQERRRLEGERRNLL
jgi:hypothetical protein